MRKDRVKFNDRIRYLENQSLISVDYLKASSLLDFNITPEKILPYIIEAQELHLEPMIGTKLYRKLQGDNLTFEYQTLLDNYISKVLIHWALVSFLNVGGVQVSEGGIYRHLPTDAEPLQRSDIDLMVKREQYKADEYAKRMLGFLNTYSTYYPEYSDCIAGGIQAKKKREILGGWYLGNTGRGGNYDDCCFDAVVSSCDGGACPEDKDIFDIVTSWGTNDIEHPDTFDPNTLQNTATTLPNYVDAKPNANYFWIVSSVDFVLLQGNNRIPLSDFNNANALTEVYVYGNVGGLFWCRIKIQDTYEAKVEFNLRKV